LSVAAVAGIGIGPLAGAVVDRIGAARVVAAANLLGVAGCLSLLFWTNGWGYGVGAFFLSANMRTFWAAFTPLVAGIAGPAELEKWFGRLRGARYVGIVSGQGLSGVFFVAGLHTGLRLLVLANGLSFVVALPPVLAAARVRRAPAVSTEDEPQQPRRGYRPVLADRVNVALAGLNGLATQLSCAQVLVAHVVCRSHLGR